MAQTPGSRRRSGPRASPPARWSTATSSRPGAAESTRRRVVGVGDAGSLPATARAPASRRTGCWALAVADASGSMEPGPEAPRVAPNHAARRSMATTTRGGRRERMPGESAARAVHLEGRAPANPSRPDLGLPARGHGALRVRCRCRNGHGNSDPRSGPNRRAAPTFSCPAGGARRSSPPPPESRSSRSGRHTPSGAPPPREPHPSARRSRRAPEGGRRPRHRR